MNVTIEFLTDENIAVPEGVFALTRMGLEHLAQIKGSFQLTILYTGNEEIQRLNREFRGIDRVTDVLSFPDLPEEEEVPYIGDIAICVPRAVEQAADIGQSAQREMAFLALHGALHLLGYDHETEEEEKEMLRLQRQISEDAFSDI